MATEKPTFMQWASHLYSREVKGKGVYEVEEQDGVPVEIPLSCRTPETLEQQISRLVRAYSQDTKQDVETLDEANDFSIPGEDEDYIEDDYDLVDNMENAIVSSLPQPVQDEQTEVATTPAEKKEEPADNAGS